MDKYTVSKKTYLTYDFVSTAKKYIEPHVRQVILGKLNMNTPYTVLLQTIEVISAARSSYIKHSLTFYLYFGVSYLPILVTPKMLSACHINAF